MKLLVTGATGFVGGAVARHLVERGYRVRALVRPGRDGARLERQGIEVAAGDLLRPDSLASALIGVQGLFHVAALYTYSSRRPADLYRTNVDGVKSLFTAARAAGVRRAVYTSTVATLKWPGAGALADETSYARLEDLPGHYKRSKLLGEQAALSFNSADFEVVVVNPTAPFGPADARPTPTGRIVLEFLRRRFPGYIATGMNTCDVDDVAQGHAVAFERGRAGERYILGGADNLSLSAIYDLLARVTGLKRRPVRIPYVAAYAAGITDWLVEAVALRREPYVPLEGLRVARHPMFVDTQKAVTGLGLKQRPAAESLERSARWYVDNGYARVRLFIPGASPGPEAAR